MADSVLLTKKGMEALQDELRRLKDVDRVNVVQALKEARAQGDLSENADYDAARNLQAQIEGRITEIEIMLSNAKLIDEKLGGVRIVGLGATVVVRNENTGKVSEYKIVGPVETNPKIGQISNESALAQAVLNHGQNERVTVKAINPYDVTILEIKR